MKVLILAVPIGAGHMKAASAIQGAILAIDPHSVVRFENCFKWSWPFYGRAYQTIYDYGQKQNRTLLKFLYGGVGVDKGSSSMLYKFHKVLAHRFRWLLTEYRPDYILCTHFSPAYFSAIYKKEFKFKIGTVVTDYFVHPHWVNNEIDHYFIPHEFLSDQIIKYGGKREKIFPFGIPVALQLDGFIDKAAARARFGLSIDRISATVMGSRVFGGEWLEIVNEIDDFDYDLLVLCGENKTAMERIKALKGKANKKTYGMVERIHELVATTDILVTKAGGITTTEATKAGPCLLFANSIVGLEDKNENFLIEHGAALKLAVKNARQVMGELLSNPDKMIEMRKNLKKLGKRKSAENIAKVILGIHDAPRV
jgi:processive 1,2-diacylglycerol beta-glucosyltransferase